MKIIHQDLKKRAVKLRVENLDDLWYLSTLIDNKDTVEGETYRKIRIGSKDEKSEVVKKKVFLKIKVDKVEFSKHSNTLRVSGEILDGPQDVSRGSSHTINVEQDTILKIEKVKWLRFQEEKLKEAASEEGPNILIVVFDRENAVFARLKRQGFEIISKITGQVQKKAMEQQEQNFYQTLSKAITEYDKRENYSHIIIASPAFFKEYLLKEINDEKIKKKTVTATCSSVSDSAINEVMKRDELKSVLADERNAKEINLVEELLEKISKDDLAVYGLKQVKTAAQTGAIETLILTDSLIHKKRTDDLFEEIENIMKFVDNAKGNVHIINSDHEGGKKLNSLGGVGGILRYKIEY